MDIIAETNTYLLVYKPAGLAVESRSITQPDLFSMLRTERDKKPREYLAVINRLDQVVEGLVLFAKTKKAAAALSAQMRGGRIRKEYLAVVDGVPERLLLPEAVGTNNEAEDCLKAFEEADRKEWMLCNDLLKDPKSNTSRVVPKGTPGAKEAKLFFTCPDTRDGRSLLRIRLLTGRHHQIRVQLAFAGLPICGDRKYNPEAQSAFPQLCFPALCACALQFDDPESSERSCFSIQPKGEAFQAFPDSLIP